MGKVSDWLFERKPEAAGKNIPDVQKLNTTEKLLLEIVEENRRQSRILNKLCVMMMDQLIIMQSPETKFFRPGLSKRLKKSFAQLDRLNGS